MASAAGVPKGYIDPTEDSWGTSGIALMEQYKPFARHVSEIQQNFLPFEAFTISFLARSPFDFAKYVFPSIITVSDFATVWSSLTTKVFFPIFSSPSSAKVPAAPSPKSSLPKTAGARHGDRSKFQFETFIAIR